MFKRIKDRFQNVKNDIDKESLLFYRPSEEEIQNPDKSFKEINE